MIDLSILVCSTHTRYKTFGPKIAEQVWGQLAALSPEDQKRVEILILTDNKQMMLGQKRNIMVDMAQGRYVQFVDDDDRIEPDMFSAVLEATDSDADVITFLASVSINGDSPRICRYSKDFAQDRNVANRYERLPNHICCVKRELAVKVSFPHLLHGEDAGYSKLLLPHLRTEHHIPRVLYHYDYSDETTEAQFHRKAAIRVRPNQTPVVDVIILSNASSLRLRNMTQRTIDTCVAGANSLPVNVIVMEQCPGVGYRHATTIKAPETFHYNAFVNQAAGQGKAPWIMVANNDLVFTDGWLHQLLAADHPLMSPKEPDDPRQAEITCDTIGYTNGKHFSGWCFMLLRTLWAAMGGLDECVTFWCSDDVVIEQARALEVAPMLVVGAKVHHLVSATLRTAPDDGELTWRQVDIFNRKYGQSKFADDPRFAHWKQRQLQ